MSQPTNPFDSPQQPPQARSGMSSGTKVLLGLGVGCGLVLLLCCGGFAGFSYYIARNFQQVTDPAQIGTIADGIVTIEVPDYLKPKMGLDGSIPFVGSVKLAVFGDDADHNTLVLTEFVGGEGAAGQQFDQAMREAGHQGPQEVEVTDSEEFKTTINGQEATFIVGQGKHHNDREVWQATGAFEGKSGPARLVLQLDAEQHTKEELLEILHSMK